MSPPTAPQGAVNFRRPLPTLYRSANLSFLTEQGQTELLGLRLSRVIDLRDRRERLVDAPPLLGRTSTSTCRSCPGACKP